MPIWIRVARRNIPDICVLIQALRVPKIRIRHWNRRRRPIRADEPPQAVGVIPRPEVIEPGFGVPFFAGELVEQWDQMRVRDNAARIPNAVLNLRTRCPRSRAAFFLPNPRREFLATCDFSPMRCPHSPAVFQRAFLFRCRRLRPEGYSRPSAAESAAEKPARIHCGPFERVIARRSARVFC